MHVVAVAIVFANVVVAEKPIAFVALGAYGLMADCGPVSTMNMVRNRCIAGVMFGVHTESSTVNEPKAYRIFKNP
jgi:hypothetical protein